MKRDERIRLLEEKLLKMKEYEGALYAKGLNYVAGVDEAGRGPLAGPVVAAAVVLPLDFRILGIDDSKKLSPKKRDKLYYEIINNSLSFGIGIVDNQTIDSINILEATRLAMYKALKEAERSCSIEHVLIDALRLEKITIPQTAIIKGDSKSVSIAAASILAKVTRDRLMIEYHDTYPVYAFDSNKGYGTRAHYEGLRNHGTCPIHRQSFLTNLAEAK